MNDDLDGPLSVSVCVDHVKNADRLVLIHIERVIGPSLGRKSTLKVIVQIWIERFT
jgi:hypothetical protein